MRRAPRSIAAVLSLAAIIAAAGCNNDDNNVTGPDQNRVFNQIQRLGNPLVSEVFLTKRDHAYHGATGPKDDAANFGPFVRSFVATVAGRSTNLQNTLATVLLPDMLVVQTDKDPATAGYLSWALANGWGGRKLTDDIMDASLSAVFGTIIEAPGASCANFQLPLCTDNVPSHSAFIATFPYLAPAK